MPVPIVGVMLTYLQQKLSINAWDGEVPLFDPNGNPIVPGVTTTPSDWPIVTCKMSESGLVRNWKLEGWYSDEGPLLVQIWGTTRLQTETLLGTAEALLVSATQWAAMTQLIPGWTNDNFPYAITEIGFNSWTCVQEEGVRTKNGDLLYRGDIPLEVVIQGYQDIT